MQSRAGCAIMLGVGTKRFRHNNNNRKEKAMDEKTYLKRRLTKYRKAGAILDEGKCRKARAEYWEETERWKNASPVWRQTYAQAAKLACGLRLFEGGYFVHPCGDPDTEWNIRYYAGEVRFYPLPHAEIPKTYGAEAVRTYMRNIERGRDELTSYFGSGSAAAEDAMDAVRAAAAIFGIELKSEKGRKE